MCIFVDHYSNFISAVFSNSAKFTRCFGNLLNKRYSGLGEIGWSEPCILAMREANPLTYSIVHSESRYIHLKTRKSLFYISAKFI